MIRAGLRILQLTVAFIAATLAILIFGSVMLLAGVPGRLLRAAADVPFLFKQWGEWIEQGHHEEGPTVHRMETDDQVAEAAERWLSCTRPGLLSPDGRLFHSVEEMDCESARLMDRQGKHRTGRLLDGITHDGRPEA